MFNLQSIFGIQICGNTVKYFQLFFKFLYQVIHPLLQSGQLPNIIYEPALIFWSHSTKFTNKLCSYLILLISTKGPYQLCDTKLVIWWQSGRKAKLTTHLHLASSLKIMGFLPSVSPVPSWPIHVRFYPYKQYIICDTYING